jgi:hypothetical protein
MGQQKFEQKRLAEMKQGCEANRSSTLAYHVPYRHSAVRVKKWLARQATRGSQRVAGKFAS